MTPERINQLAKSIHEQNVKIGWWDDPDRCVFQALQLVNTEIAEATEADRRRGVVMDDHIPGRRAVEVELADACIRLLDLAGRFGWTYAPVVLTQFWLYSAAKNLAGKHLGLTGSVCNLADALFYTKSCTEEAKVIEAAINSAYSRCIEMCLDIAEREVYDLEGAIVEKHHYNLGRADHDRENRKAFKGKRY